MTHTGIEHLKTPPQERAPAPIGTLDPARLAQIEMIFFDCDGVMTDGRVWVDADGGERKAFSVIDGHGVAMLRESGVLVGMITRSPHGISTARASKLRFDVVRTGVLDKAAALVEILTERGLTGEVCAFMGDDLPDLAAFAKVGLSIAPPGARAEVLGRAIAVSRAPAGSGAVREVCDAIVRARLAHPPLLTGEEM